MESSALPLACTSGMPSVAALELVEQLVEAGCRVLAHADFDAAGLTIVDQLVAVGATPWKMGVEHHRRAAPRPVCGLPTLPSEVGWAPGLAGQMVRTARAGFEEHLIAELLAPDPPCA